jgi:hypothetical protein
VAAISSHQLSLHPSSCPRYSDLHRGLSPRLSIYPIHPSIHPSISPTSRSVDQSSSLSLTHSIHPSIHPLLPASRCFRSVEPARNQSIDPSVPINHHQPESDRRLRLRQSINRSINPINRSINQARNHVIIQSFNHSIDKPAAQHVSNPSVQSIQPSINQPDRLINQSESIVGLWNRRRSFLAISRKGFSKSAHFVRVQKILLEVHKSQAISRKAFAKSAHFVVLQKMLLYLCKITFGRPTKSSISGGLSVQSRRPPCSRSHNVTRLFLPAPLRGER